LLLRLPLDAAWATLANLNDPDGIGDPLGRGPSKRYWFAISHVVSPR
jgi:hypothetical protein